MQPPIVRRVDRCHVGRVGRACSCAHLTPPRPPRHSLRLNNLNDEAKQAVQHAAGSGVCIYC